MFMPGTDNSKVNIQTGVRKEIDRHGYEWVFPYCIKACGHISSFTGKSCEYIHTTRWVNIYGACEWM